LGEAGDSKAGRVKEEWSRGPCEDAAFPGKVGTAAMKQILIILAAIGTAILLSQLLFTFYQWNREQTCATAGGRNCGGPPQRIER
jgi:hypothetical protein